MDDEERRAAKLLRETLENAERHPSVELQTTFAIEPEKLIDLKREEIRKHIASCESCRRSYDRMKGDEELARWWKEDGRRVEF